MRDSHEVGQFYESSSNNPLEINFNPLKGILFKEPCNKPNPCAGSRPSDIIALYLKHKALNPNPTAQQRDPPRCSPTR